MTSEEERIVRQTGIVATIGPASNARAVIADLMDAGVKVFRLNFSHGMVESLRVLRVCRKSAVQARRVALQMIQMSIVCAPDKLREPLRNMTRMQLIRTLAA